MTRPHPDDLAAVLAERRPLVLATVALIQNAIRSTDINTTKEPSHAQDYTRR